MTERPIWYILDENNEPIPCNAMEFSVWCTVHNKRVAEDTINGYIISTVFLGIDHSYTDDALPVLFETMIYIPKTEDSSTRAEWGVCDGHEFQLRYCTYREAKTAHETIVTHMRAGKTPSEVLEIMRGNSS